MRVYLIFIALVWILAGCATQYPEVNTAGTTFSCSTKPSLRIEFPREFEYLGYVEEEFRPNTVGGGVSTSKAKNTMYFYGSTAKEKYMRKLIRISMLELGGRGWSPETMLRVNNPLKRGVIKFGTRNFQYTIKVSKTYGKATSRYLLDKGFTTPICNLWMMFGRVFDDNLKIYITYFEDVSNFKEFAIVSCEDWFDREMLNDKQNKYLEDFKARTLDNLSTQ